MEVGEQWWLQALITNPEGQIGKRPQRSQFEMQFISRECGDTSSTFHWPSAPPCLLSHGLKELVSQSHCEIGSQQSRWEEGIPTPLFDVNFRPTLPQWSFQEHTGPVQMPSEIWDIHMQDTSGTGLCSVFSTIWRHYCEWILSEVSFLSFCELIFQT